MKALISTIWLVLLCLGSYAQLPRLKEVQKQRQAAKDYKQDMAWDSAYRAYKKVVDDTKYANPYDRLDFSYCSLKRRDTSSFRTYLGQAIEEGVDTELIYRFYRQLSNDERTYLDKFVNSNYESLHRAFVSSHDTTLLEELDCIRIMDQVGRVPIQRIAARNKGWATDSNVYYFTIVADLGDSINYVRIMRLLSSANPPGYHNCGAAVQSLWQALLHFDRSYVNWEYVHSALKRAVLAGDIDPDQVAAIVDRHYLRLVEKPCYYYDHLSWGDTIPFYDCSRVDQLRAEKGYESLREEYSKRKRQLPECYKGK